MSDLISRSALLRVLRHNAALHTDENGESHQLVAIDVNVLIDYIEKMPDALEHIIQELEEEKAEAQMLTGSFEDFDDYNCGKLTAFRVALEKLKAKETPTT